MCHICGNQFQEAEDCSCGIAPASEVVLVLLNHELTAAQRADFGKSSRFVKMSDFQANRWGSIPASASREEVRDWIEPILKHIRHFDSIICQGEFTAFSLVLEEANKREIPVLVACSERSSEEQVQPDGSVKKVATFRHVQWRRVN